MPIALPKYTAITSADLKEDILDFAKKDHTDENIEFLDALAAKKTNQLIYTTYIRTSAAKQVNIVASTRSKLDELAKANKWNDMKATLELARTEIDKLSVQIIKRFYATPYGARTIILWRMGMKGVNANAHALLKTYFDGRTPEDKYAAYMALSKISSKAKTVLTEHGTPPAASAPTASADQVKKNLEVDKLAKQIAVDVKECIRYLESAIKSVTKDGLPRDPVEVTRMFNSGRMRHDKVVTNWNKAVQSDRAFTTKYKAVATEKAKSDTLWATYTTKLNKR
jgi:hypothetical protein